jgi:benzoyl-CoA reductase/2-hydroxyglutaryl-CoA dehydratase subunit BcrC/BadD/HgdB
MKLESYMGAAGLRFDGDLKAFDEIISFYLDATDRIKARGKKVIAKGPLSPVEVIYAGGATAYDVATRETLLQSMLNGHSNLSYQAVEAGMSPELSPWNLVMLGGILGGNITIPVDLYSSACGGFDDQLTKSFQVMAQAGKLPLRFWDVPRNNPEAESWALTYLKKELEQIFEWMAIYTGQKTTERSLREAIRFGNLIRVDMMDLNTYLAMPRVPIAALEYYLVQMMMGDYAQDPEALHGLFTKLLEELRLRVDRGQFIAGIQPSPIRVYVMGDETQELYLFNAIEDHGGLFVGCDFRLPLYYDLIDENAEPLNALARWVWDMPNNLPTAARIKAELGSIKKQKPDAVIISSVVGSRRLPGSERLVRDLIKQELNVPVLAVETSLPHENIEKVDYQIRAFLETMN